MKKRLLSMFLCLCMLLTMVPAALAAGTTGTAAPATEDEGETSGNQITASTTTLTTGNYVLEGDVTLTSGALKVEANNKVTLNLNGKKLTNQAGANTIEVAAGGTLTIEGPGTVDNVSHQKAAVNNSGTVVLNGGTYTRSQEKGTSEEDSGSNSYYTILNHGTMTINEGVTINQGADGAGKFSSLIENGWYNGNDNTGGEPSVMTINGGTFSGGLNTIKNDDYGELTIKGGTFSSYAQACLLNWNVATVEGGTFEGTDSTDATILNGHVNDTMDKGQLTILDGTFSGKYILERMTGSGSDGIGSVEIKGGSFTGSSGIVNQGQGQDLGNGTIEISGGTFSHDVGKFCATGYASTKDETSEKYVVDVANSAQVSTNKDESGNVTATVDGNYSGGETSESGGNGSISTDNSGKVTIDVSSDDGEETTTGTTAEITVGSNALTSINKNENVKEVELKTNVGTLTISDAAWNDMTAKATEVDKTASVVIKLEDKSKESSNPVYEVTATVGEENAFDGSGDGAVTISVPYAADGEKGNVKVYCTDDGKMEDMNAALSDGILSWTTSHFSTFEVVAYDETAEVTYQTTKDGTTSVSSGSFHDALTAVASNGGTITLLKDVAMFNRLYQQNADYFRQLTLYIIAGDEKLEQVREGELKALLDKAEASGDAMDAQKANDLAAQCDRFEKKLHDLELTRMISLQMGPQTRMLQNNDTLMIEKIQSSLVNTIPLWKSQMVLALGLEHARQATAAQNAVTEMTNNLLRQNADLLKTGTIDTAREAERSIVDLETLRHTNQQLMESLDEVLRIQTEGTQKRREAEAELGRIEGELKQKLLALRT